MLSGQFPPFSLLLRLELAQAADEGKDVLPFLARARAVEGRPAGTARERAAARLLSGIAALPVPEGSAAREPSGLEGIRAVRPSGGPGSGGSAARPAAARRDRVLGAWLGRCCGCLLGIPVERWTRGRLAGFLRDTDNWPIARYLSSDVGEALRLRHGVSDEGWAYGSSAVPWINNVRHMPEDDDVNYTLIGLRVLERRGAGFTALDVAEAWLSDLPILHTFTAERAAYRNLVNGILPPDSAAADNPCREWVGAQIRADAYGYVNPGDTAAAAAMAWRDASVSHVRNGIYGSMFAAAMLAEAAVEDGAGAVVRAGLREVPEGSRLAAGVRSVMEWHASGAGWEDAVDRLHAMFDESDDHRWCHAVPNAMAVCIGLLYGDMDLGRSIGTAVAASFDKDCNGATVGSIVGMALGAARLPEPWTGPLHDTMQAGIAGTGLLRISDLADRTVEAARRLREAA